MIETIKSEDGKYYIGYHINDEHQRFASVALRVGGPSSVDSILISSAASKEFKESYLTFFGKIKEKHLIKLRKKVEKQYRDWLEIDKEAEKNVLSWKKKDIIALFIPQRKNSNRIKR